jgi:NADH-quinone oxidoreductase subunit C
MEKNMILETVKDKLQGFFPDSPPADNSQTGRVDGIIESNYAACGYHLDIQLSPNQLLAAVEILFDCGFFIETITGVDWIKENQIEAVYDFSRYDFDLCRVVIRTRTPRANPSLPTITGIYSGANWHEREAHDFFGIVFTGHPHLIPLLLPEDADFHPLLKDFKA